MALDRGQRLDQRLGHRQPAPGAEAPAAPISMAPLDNVLSRGRLADLRPRRDLRDDEPARRRARPRHARLGRLEAGRPRRHLGLEVGRGRDRRVGRRGRHRPAGGDRRPARAGALRRAGHRRPIGRRSPSGSAPSIALHRRRRPRRVDGRLEPGGGRGDRVRGASSSRRSLAGLLPVDIEPFLPTSILGWADGPRDRCRRRASSTPIAWAVSVVRSSGSPRGGWSASSSRRGAQARGTSTAPGRLVRPGACVRPGVGRPPRRRPDAGERQSRGERRSQRSHFRRSEPTREFVDVDDRDPGTST